MYNYNLYNLNILSSIEFDFLDQSNSSYLPDIEINEVDFQKKLYEDKINIDNAYIYRKNVGFFHIKAGKKILFSRENSQVNDKSLSRSMINTIFGYLLYQRGYLVLHASALKLGANSFAFLGRSGSGKSSLVADLCINHNAKFICEDVACIYSNEKKLAIKNAPPLIKLSDEISNILNLNHDSKLSLVGDRLNRSLYKANNDIGHNVLNSCFFLEWGNSFSIKKLEDDITLPVFLMSTYSSYPFNSCPTSSVAFHKNIQQFIKKIKIFKITRNKKHKFMNSVEIIEYLQDLIK